MSDELPGNPSVSDPGAAAGELGGPAVGGDEHGCFGWPRSCAHDDDLECWQAALLREGRNAPAAPPSGPVMGTVTVDDLVWLGEDGQWIGAVGHVDLTEFAEAANALSRRELGLHDDELPHPEFEPQHVWYRPMTFGWFQRHHRSTDRCAYEMLVADGAVETCGPDDDGAQPWTVIETGA